MELDEPLLTNAEIEALIQRIDRPLVLVGLMGVGKTSVGRKLAKVLRSDFIDADEEIERAARMTIPEIFEKYGEAHFRDGERRVIARLMEQADNRPAQPMEASSGPGAVARPRGQPVIATGGGAFVDPATRALILEKAITVWLDSDLEVLVERIGRKDTRPLLRGGNPRAILGRLKAEREGAYAQAPIHVKSTAGLHVVTVMRVLKGINSWL